MLARYRESLPLIDGAVDAVRRLAGTFTLGVASSSNRPLIEVVLERAGIAEHFAAVVSSEEVARGKPAPDVYLEAARRLGVDARTLRRRRGLLERDPRGARGRDARARLAERALSACRRRARARRRGRRLAGRADLRAHPEVGEEVHSRPMRTRPAAVAHSVPGMSILPSAPPSVVSARGVVKRYGKHRRARGPRRRDRPRASPACSAPTAPARRRSSRCSSGSAPATPAS